MMSKMYRSSIQQTMTGREKSTMMNYEEDTNIFAQSVMTKYYTDQVHLNKWN